MRTYQYNANQIIFQLSLIGSKGSMVAKMKLKTMVCVYTNTMLKQKIFQLSLSGSKASMVAKLKHKTMVCVYTNTMLTR